MIKKSTKSADLATQRQQAESLFKSIGEGALTTDEFGRITRVNVAATEILGFSEKEMLGLWFPKIIPAFTLDNVPVSLIDRPITKSFLTGTTVSAKLIYVRKNGQKVPVAVNASPFLHEGRPLGSIEVFRDITYEHEVDRMKSEFKSLAAHQLRTPLSAIKTYSHMLTDGIMGSLSEEQAKALDTIINSANRMNELISTLLNITRIESGVISVSLQDIDIKKIASEAIAEMDVMARRKNIQLNLKTAQADDFTVTGDRLIIKEVLTNLISNAIKYTPDNGWVKVILRPRANDFHITVSDSGWGIPLYSQDQVFSKFFRANNVVSRETNGIGLGLYLVKGLLEAVGGKVWFNSVEGNGTSFFVSLPLAP